MVVKPDSSVAADLMGTEIALAVGVRAPKLRLVECGGPEQVPFTGLAQITRVGPVF